MPDGREGADQANEEQSNCQGGDAREVGILILPEVVKDHPGDEENDDRPTGFA